MGLSLVSFLLFLPFFFVDIGTFLNIEHDTALLYMSTYIAERWHRAHGLCMCWGGEAPFVRNSTTTTTTHTHLAIRFELVRFILQQRCYGREDLLLTDYSPGVNRVVSAIDVARRVVERFQASSATTREGWEHLDRFQLGTSAPWDPVAPLPVRFLDRETAREELISARRCQPGVWIYTDGSVQPGACGATAIFEDPHGPFGQARLSLTLGPLQSSTDAELAGIRLALDHLASQIGWHHVYIVSDSQVALLQVRNVGWRQTRTSIWEVHRRALALHQAGHHVELWWAPGHADIEGNEAADSVARTAALGTRSGTEPFSVSRSMLDHHLFQWYHSQA